jgi:hypothetical protein
MRMYREVAVYSHSLLISLSEGGEWSISCTSCYNPWRKIPHTYLTGGCVGHRAGVDAVDKKDISCPCFGIELIPWPSSPQPVITLTELSWLLLIRVSKYRSTHSLNPQISNIRLWRDSFLVGSSYNAFQNQDLRG